MTDGDQANDKLAADAADCDRNPVDELAEEFVERLRRGEAPSVTEYANRHPELADEIRLVLPTLAMLEKCGEENLADGGSESRNENAPVQLGEYQIIREVARGGMGIVYEAEHDSMGRRVALKVLPVQMAARGSHLRRFHREARSAGRLHHTNIVPVFEVGTDGGYHYYAMQFIRGQSLDLVFDELKRLQDETGDGATSESMRLYGAASQNRSVAWNLKSGQFQAPAFDSTLDDPADSARLEEPNSEDREATLFAGSGSADSGSADSVSQTLRTGTRLAPAPESTHSSSARHNYFHRVALVGLQVADALSYAHSQRVLHRDIKPSNIILDTAGVAWITDFGLAKNDEGDLTQTGDIVGTLRYMAPERFSGDADAGADVYGLGLTLYELCTLRPAFSETDRVRLIHVITTQDPTRPRRINSNVPRDLETIILKAIERQPSRRYASAREFAEDLRRFLSDRPISARRSSVVEQTWRLCRRNPLPTTLVTCMLALLALIVVGSVRFGYSSQQQAEQLRQENVRALAAEQDAVEANKLATERLYELNVGRAQSGRFSGRIGQNIETMNAIDQAVSLLPKLDFTEAQRQAERGKLRNLAVAAMSLIDLKEEKVWKIGQATAVILDADHKLQAQGDTQGNIKIRHLDADIPDVILASVGPPARWLSFSNDRSYLISQHHHGIPMRGRLAAWDLRREKLVFQVLEDLGWAAARISPDSSSVAIGRKRGVIDIVSLADGSLITSVPTGFDPRHLVFDATGRRLACSSGRKIQIWELGQESPEKEFQLEASISRLDWNSAHSILAAGTMEGDLVVWHDALFQLPPWYLEPHRGAAVRLAIHPDGDLLVSGGWDDFIRVTDLTTQQQVLRLNDGELLECGFSRDGNQLPFKRKQFLGVWSLPKRPLTVLRSNSDQRRGETFFHPTNRRLLMSPVRDEVELWDVQNRRVIGTIATASVHCRFSADGSAVLTASAAGIRRWPIEITENSDQELQVAVDESTLIYEGASERFSVDASGRFIAVDTGFREIVVVDSEDDSLTKRIGPHDNLDRVVMMPSGDAVISSTWQGWGVRVWDRVTGKPLSTLGARWRSASIAVSRSGDRLLAVSGTDLVAWETQTWKTVWQHERSNPDKWPGPVRFSNNGRYVACCDSRYVPQLCDAKTGLSIAILEAPKREGVGELSFSVDDELLAIYNSSNIHVWDLANLQGRLSQLGLSWE